MDKDEDNEIRRDKRDDEKSNMRYNACILYYLSESFTSSLILFNYSMNGSM